MSIQSAEVFAGLHRAGEPLLLANAWDVASAVAVQAAGARAIATTSAGAAVRAGAVGVNLEDRRGGASLFTAAQQAERLAAARAAAGDVPVWINARTDIFLSQAYPSTRAGTAAALERAAVYKPRGPIACSSPGWSTCGRSRSWRPGRCRSR